jgi:hypothetical protein
MLKEDFVLILSQLRETCGYENIVTGNDLLNFFDQFAVNTSHIPISAACYILVSSTSSRKPGRPIRHKSRKRRRNPTSPQNAQHASNSRVDMLKREELGLWRTYPIGHQVNSPLTRSRGAYSCGTVCVADYSFHWMGGASLVMYRSLRPSILLKHCYGRS